MFNFIKEEVQEHVDFVNDFIGTHQDFRTDFRCDVTGLGKLEGTQLAEVLALEEQIKQISAKATPTPQPSLPGWTNIPMTPVDSSFIKGTGAYKGKLLLEFHHDPGNIWGFDVQGQGSKFFTELMMAGSKGGWVWDKLLGKPSEFGMAKGKFFAYEGKNGKMNFYTTPGAEFVHKYGRPTKFTYNPVGYLTSETMYNIKAKFGKEWKESVVTPSESREPVDPKLLAQKQQIEKFKALMPEFERLQAIEELRPLFEKVAKAKTFQELMTELDRLQKFDDLQRALRKKGIKKDFVYDILENLLESQLTLVPTIVPVIEKDLTMDRWITKYGRHIWINNWYTPEELNKYDPKTGAGIIEMEPWLRIDRSVEITQGISMGLINRTLETFPLKLKNFINEFRVFNKITDHPSMMKSKGKVPKSYEAVGWSKTYDNINGVYIPSENNAYISIEATPHTVRHELGHAVWYGMSKRERKDFKAIWERRKWDLFDKADEARIKARTKTGHAKESLEIEAMGWEYEANDVGEFFAESFERYYKARRPVWTWITPYPQKQPFPEVSTFFRRRMKKYEKD